MEAKITYGVFDLKEENGTVHSVPLVNGEVMEPHTLSSTCVCHPTVEQYLFFFVGHNMIH